MINYNGDEIMIEEMPQGCVVYRKNRSDGLLKIDFAIQISSKRDAIALMKSLADMIGTLT